MTIPRGKIIPSISRGQEVVAATAVSVVFGAVVAVGVDEHFLVRLLVGTAAAVLLWLVYATSPVRGDESGE